MRLKRQHSRSTSCVASSVAASCCTRPLLHAVVLCILNSCCLQFGGTEGLTSRLSTLSRTQLLLLGSLGAFLCALFFLVAPFLRRYGGNAPYLSSSPLAIRTVLQVCSAVATEKKRKVRMVDIGSGNGELVVEAAKLGLECEGYELNWILVLASLVRAWAAGPEVEARFHWKNLWGANLSSFDVVVVFGVPEIMAKLQARFVKDLKPGTVVCSNQFPLPIWVPFKEENGVLCYKAP